MSNTKFKFYIHFIDDYSRYTWLYPLKFKSDALNAFTQFKSLAENMFDRKIKRLHSDSGGEYQAFNRLLMESGIEFTHSCPHTSAQNGRAERKHRNIVEMGLTLLAQASMPLKYWSDAFHTVVYLINRLPTLVLEDKSPYEVIHSKRPDYKFIKVFGAACHPCLRPYQSNKFQFHSTKCVNLGYSEFFKGYKCLSNTGRIYVSRNVIFDESVFPFKTGFLNTYVSEKEIQVQLPFLFTPLSNTGTRQAQNETAYSTQNSTDHMEHGVVTPQSSASQTVNATSSASFDNEEQSAGSKEAQEESKFSQQYVDNESEEVSQEQTKVQQLPGHHMITRAKSGIFKPKTYMGVARADELHEEPGSVEEALKHTG